MRKLGILGIFILFFLEAQANTNNIKVIDGDTINLNGVKISFQV